MATATQHQRSTAAADLDQATWNERALALAVKAHADGTARHIGTNDIGAHLYRVPSWTHDGAVYVVSMWPGGDVLCSCTASAYGRPCRHAGAALTADMQREEAMATQQDEPMRSYCNGLEW